MASADKRPRRRTPSARTPSNITSAPPRSPQQIRASHSAQLHLAIFAGGVVGALSRALLARAFPWDGQGWPWPTFAVNLAGTLMLGHFVARLQERLPPSTYRRPLLGTGFCGADNVFDPADRGDQARPPSGRCGLVARAIAASAYAPRRNVDLSSGDIDQFRVVVASSPLADWFARRFPSTDGDERDEWQLVAPCNGFEFTVERDRSVNAGGGTDLYARVQFLLPHGFYGQNPKLLVDLLARDAAAELPPGAAEGDLDKQFDLAGDPWRPDLPELVDVLDALGETIGAVAPAVLEPIVHRSWRERSGSELLLVGPNYHVRGKPRTSVESLRLPDFPRFVTGSDRAELMIQTPPNVSAYDRRGPA